GLRWGRTREFRGRVVGGERTTGKEVPEGRKLASNDPAVLTVRLRSGTPTTATLLQKVPAKIASIEQPDCHQSDDQWNGAPTSHLMSPVRFGESSHGIANPARSGRRVSVGRGVPRQSAMPPHQSRTGRYDEGG